MRVALAMLLAVTAPLACGEPVEDGPMLRGARAGAVAVAEGRVTGTGDSGLRVREQPSTASTHVTTLAEGDLVSITCRARGETINGNSTWDYLGEHRGYVSDAFITITSGEAGIPPCEAEEPREPPGPKTSAEVDIDGPPVRAHVQAFANEACAVVDACRASTYAGHQPSADLALDFPTGEAYGKLPTDGHAFGDRLADFALANRAKYRIDYVIYRQRINHGDGWEAMEDRGGITQNHFDHVHVSFNP